VVFKSSNDRAKRTMPNDQRRKEIAMPIVRVSLGARRSQEQKRALAKDFTEALMRHCDAEPKNINIIFEDVPLDDWLVGTDTVDQP
jgi:4-oxalocrotonate tautomerase